jgi:cytochrome P450
VAGNETTTTLIANVMILLIQWPDEMAAVHTDPQRLVAVIEESLRLDAPIQMLPKRAVVDVKLSNQQIRAGDLLYVVYASANHDESRYTCPADFDPDRANARTHLSFGKGAHFCVGAALARSEARVAVGRLLARATDWAFDPVSQRPLRRGLSMQLRGPSHLDLVFQPVR